MVRLRFLIPPIEVRILAGHPELPDIAEILAPGRFAQLARAKASAIIGCVAFGCPENFRSPARP
jgi:hypothetical protein